MKNFTENVSFQYVDLFLIFIVISDDKLAYRLALKLESKT